MKRIKKKPREKYPWKMQENKVIDFWGGNKKVKGRNKPIKVNTFLTQKPKQILFPFDKPKKIKSYGDFDFDGTPNKFDCNPFSPGQDGIFSRIIHKVTGGRYGESKEQEIRRKIEKMPLRKIKTYEPAGKVPIQPSRRVTAYGGRVGKPKYSPGLKEVMRHPEAPQALAKLRYAEDVSGLESLSPLRLQEREIGEMVAGIKARGQGGKSRILALQDKMEQEAMMEQVRAGMKEEAGIKRRASLAVMKARAKYLGGKARVALSPSILREKGKELILPGGFKAGTTIRTDTDPKTGKIKTQKLPPGIIEASSIVVGRIAAIAPRGIAPISPEYTGKKGRPKGRIKYYIPGVGPVGVYEFRRWQGGERKKAKDERKIRLLQLQAQLRQSKSMPQAMQAVQQEQVYAQAVQEAQQMEAPPQEQYPQQQQGYPPQQYPQQPQQYPQQPQQTAARAGSILETPNIFSAQNNMQQRNILNAPSIMRGDLYSQPVAQVRVGAGPATNPAGNEYYDINPITGQPLMKRRVTEKWANGSAI